MTLPTGPKSEGVEGSLDARSTRHSAQTKEHEAHTTNYKAQSKERKAQGGRGVVLRCMLSTGKVMQLAK
eukprot:1137954-Pelagomonas_calceolata.AAC.1